jgi:tRNA/tmRNA/rRNA uracil-C5-methylase (TrmA/RlmC/RlmD family)
MIHRGQELTLLITAYAFGGRGIARLQENDQHFTIFVDNAFPGQTVLAKIETKRKNFAEAKLLEVIERSADEQSQLFQEISGGPYIHVPVAIQEKYKQESTLETFARLSGLRDSPAKFDVFISSPAHYHYRNKMEYSFSCIEHDLETNQELDDAFALGFKRRGTWWKVESLNKPSGLFDEIWESKLKELRLFLFKTGLPAWHPPQKKGFFRHIVVRKSFLKNELLINLVTSSEGIENFDLKAFTDFLLNLHPGRIAGLWHTINDNVADMVARSLKKSFPVCAVKFRWRAFFKPTLLVPNCFTPRPSTSFLKNHLKTATSPWIYFAEQVPLRNLWPSAIQMSVS